MSLGHGASIVRSGLVLHLDAANTKSYPGSGTTWTDLSGQGNNGTLVNSPTFNSENNGSFVFNGTNQYGTVSGTPLNTTAYTKHVWFRLSSTFDNNLISSDVGGHFMFFNSSNRLYCGHTVWTGFPTTYGSVATFSNNVWYCVTLTFDTTNGMSIYVNGVLDSTYTTQKTAPSGGQTNIACYSTGGNLLNGRIAQAMIYNRVLTTTEISRAFEGSRGRYGI